MSTNWEHNSNIRSMDDYHSARFTDSWQPCDLRRVRAAQLPVDREPSGRVIAWGGVALFAGVLLAMYLFGKYLPVT